MYMAELASILFGISAGLTILYYIIKTYVFENPTTLKIVTSLYYLLLLGGVVTSVLAETSTMCGEVQPGYGIVYGVLPWVLIFGAFSVLLQMCPGWKSPFSNTFGYLYAKIRGVNTYLNDILNTGYKSKELQKIYNDPSLLINTFTPVNFDSAIKNLKSNNIINSSRTNFTANVNSLRGLVQGKDDVAECIWKILVAGLISSISASQIANLQCTHSVKQLEENHTQHMKAVSEKAEQEKNTKSKEYYVRE